MSYKTEINLIPASIRLRGRRALIIALAAAIALAVLAGAAYVMVTPSLRAAELQRDIDDMSVLLAPYDIPAMQSEQTALAERYEAYAAVVDEVSSSMTYSAILGHIGAHMDGVRLLNASYAEGGYADLTFEAATVEHAMAFLGRLADDSAFPVLHFSEVTMIPGGGASVSVRIEPAAEGGDAR